MSDSVGQKSKLPCPQETSEELHFLEISHRFWKKIMFKNRSEHEFIHSAGAFLRNKLCVT